MLYYKYYYYINITIVIFIIIQHFIKQSLFSNFLELQFHYLLKFIKLSIIIYLLYMDYGTNYFKEQFYF